MQTLPLRVQYFFNCCVITLVRVVMWRDLFMNILCDLQAPGGRRPPNWNQIYQNRPSLSMWNLLFTFLAQRKCVICLCDWFWWWSLPSVSVEVKCQCEARLHTHTHTCEREMISGFVKFHFIVVSSWSTIPNTQNQLQHRISARQR